MPPKRPSDEKYAALVQRYQQPPTQAEAMQFISALRSGAFRNAAHLAAYPKRELKLGQHGSGGDVPVARDKEAREALVGQALQKKLELSTKIAQSDVEHARDAGTMEVLFGLGRYVQLVTKARFIPGPPKGWDGVIRKTMDFQTTYKDDGTANRGYEGNYSSLKDEIRMTLVCENEAMYNLVKDVVLQTAGIGGMPFAKKGYVNAAEDDCGYSGINFVIVLPNGEFGEIQINVPSIMFGKMSPKDFKAQLKTSDADYDALKHRFRLPGGYGHALYEIYRVGKGSPRSNAAAALSRTYYKLLRSAPNAAHAECESWKQAVNEFRQSDDVVQATFLHAGLFPEMGSELQATRGRSTTAYEQATRNRGNAQVTRPTKDGKPADPNAWVGARERSNAIHRRG